MPPPPQAETTSPTTTTKPHHRSLNPAPRYTITITFHSAQHLPPADFPTFTSDPYVLASLRYPVPPSNLTDPRKSTQFNTDKLKHSVKDEDLYPPVTFRSTTKRQTLNPVWGEESGSRWVVANVPYYGIGGKGRTGGSAAAGGSQLEGKKKHPGKVRLRVELWDEDEGARDDRLGGVDISIDRFIEEFENKRPHKAQAQQGQSAGGVVTTTTSNNEDAKTPEVFKYRLAKRHAGRKGYLLRICMPDKLKNKIADDESTDDEDGTHVVDAPGCSNSSGPSVCLSVQVEDFQMPDGYTLGAPEESEKDSANEGKENVQEKLKMIDRPYTLGPQSYSQHFSPLLGHIAGTKSNLPPPPRQGHQHPHLEKMVAPLRSKNKKQKRFSRLGSSIETYLFAGTQIRLPGPVPAELCHPYIAFKPFVKGYFSKQGIKGRILRRGLKRQFKIVYGWDSRSSFGTIDMGEGEGGGGGVEGPIGVGGGDRKVGMAKTFLQLIEWGGNAHRKVGSKKPENTNSETHNSSSTSRGGTEEGVSATNSRNNHNSNGNTTNKEPRRVRGRIYTYVLTLDSLLRFTPTGPEFGINFLSKHSMHSNIAPVIAYSGEFYVTYHPPVISHSEDHHNHIHPHHHRHDSHHDNSEGENGHDAADQPPTSQTNSDNTDTVNRDTLAPPAASTSRPFFGSFHRSTGNTSNASSTTHHSHTKSISNFFFPQASTSDPSRPSTPPDPLAETSTTLNPHEDPSNYILHIDNNSGTYRPAKELLPLFKEYLEHCFSVGRPGGLKAVETTDCFDEEAEGRKKDFREGKKRALKDGDEQPKNEEEEEEEEEEPTPLVYLQRTSSSISSLESSLHHRAERKAAEREAAEEEAGQRK